MARKRKLAANERLDVNATLTKYGCLHMIEGRSWRRKVKIEINPRLSRGGHGRLGQVTYRSCLIELSSRILAEGYESIRETLVHELCHLIAYHEGKETGHGELFHRLMKKYWSPDHHGKRWHQTPLTTELKAAEDGRKVWVKKEVPNA